MTRRAGGDMTTKGQNMTDTPLTAIERLLFHVEIDASPPDLADLWSEVTALAAERDAALASAGAAEQERTQAEYRETMAADMAVQYLARAEAADAEVERLRAELPRAWKAGRDAAATRSERFTECCQSCAGVGDIIRDLIPPADLAEGGDA